MTVYLCFDDVVAMHTEMLERLGLKPQPLLRPDQLHSAVDRPRWAAQFQGADLICQAAWLTTGIARGHGFVDGNKRVAQLSGTAFLELNGMQVTDDLLDMAKLLEQLCTPAFSDAQADIEMERFLRYRVAPVARRRFLAKLLQALAGSRGNETS